MVASIRRTVRTLAALAPLALGCARARPQPALAIDSARVTEQRTTLADAAFMQGMIGHHAQALYMTRLVPARSRSADVRALAQRIEVSQRDEIALMTRWLVAHGQPVPDTTHVVQGHDVAAHRMPGMLTGTELLELANARGEEFDRLFLALMIRHHEGALAMVAQLLSRPGGGQDPEAYRFAADVDADQRAEITRMRGMLAARGSPDSGS